jgi:hypothetical protein
MKKINIFCEGITDQVFIADCLTTFLNIQVIREPKKDKKDKLDIFFYEFEENKEINKINVEKLHELKAKNSNLFRIYGEIIEVGGCTNLTNDIYIQRLKENIETGFFNIVIFDADFPHDAEGDIKGNGNKGIENCTQKLKDIKRKHDVVFYYYLWPNNEHDGMIENLLHKLIPEDKMSIFNCIENFQECLKNSRIPSLKIADLKDKIGYYLHTALQKSEPGKRDYCNTAYWNLNHNEIGDLTIFKDFLVSCIV